MLVSHLPLRIASGRVEREGDALVVAWGQVLSGHEGGVGGADLDTDAMHEGEVALVEVVRTPAHAHGVEGDDAGCEAGLLRPSKEGESDFFVSWPTWHRYSRIPNISSPTFCRVIDMKGVEMAVEKE